MDLRKIQRTNILYIILIDDYDIELPFVPPKNVNFQSIDILKFLPKNLYQLYDPHFYTISEINDLYYNPYTVAFFKRTDQLHIVDHVKQTEHLTVILLEETKALDKRLKKSLNILNKKFVYYLNLDEVQTKDGESINKLLSQLINCEDIFNHYKIALGSQRSFLAVDYQLNELKYYNYFLPTKTNFLTYNNYLGNFGYPYDTDSKEIEKNSKEAMLHPKSFNRLNSYIPQLKAFDNLFSKYKLTQNFEQQLNQLNSIFFCLPFHNPDIKDFFSDKSSPLAKKVLSALQIEQSTNYVNLILSNEEDEPFYRAGAQMQKERLNFLDSTCFLLASFNLVPYVRLPLLGKTIYRELSFISPNQFNKFLTLKSQLKLIKTLKKIGAKISSSIFSDEFVDHIKHRNSQIISLTDLPFEWTEIEEIPLSFTHDITRIPETSFNNQLISFALNSTLDFEIDENIIYKTLVIFGTEDDEFVKWHKMIFDLAKEKGFIVEVCLNNSDFIAAVKKHKPDFLIADTHGAYDEQTKETYLRIGNDKLTYQVIIENQLYIPLVFLSACGTAPTYGTFNPIANAFLQLGSRSVTSTYLPVEIDNATMVYLGILNNLNKVAHEGKFKSWLEYICYTIRSSFLHRIYAPLLLELNPDKSIENEYFKHAQDILAFDKRKHVFNQTQKFLNSLPVKKQNLLKPKAYEFLYYTNIGRGDLVMFKRHIENLKK